MKCIRVTVFVAAVCAAVVLPAHWAATEAQQPRPPVKSTTFDPLVSVDGRDNFFAYCAACHGVSGRGDGPAVPALKAVPPDLTTMAARAGTFDLVATERFIAGLDKVPAGHGSADMPVWGPIFRSQGSHEVASMRLQNLAKYLQRIQRTS